MIHPVLMLARNNLELTKRAIDSVFSQDIGTTLMLVDNSTTDEVANWARDQGRIAFWPMRPPLGVTAGWNFGLHRLFTDGWTRVLVVNNDLVLPTWFLRELLHRDVPFVSGVSVDVMPTELPERIPLDPHPDFSAFLIHRTAWQTVGKFNPKMKLYASDNAWHVEAHRKGVRLWKANVPFYHERSSTLNLASEEDRRAIQIQADADREVFRSLYGCLPWDPEYDELFK